MTRLLASPKDYRGRRVRVIGVYQVEFEANGLYLSRFHLEAHDTQSAIWLRSGSISEADMERANGKVVLVQGVFDELDHGHMGMWSGALKDVDRMTLWPPPRPEKVPETRPGR